MLASAPHAAVLPQVICYVRNHGKSVGPGRGAGTTTFFLVNKFKQELAPRIFPNVCEDE